MHIDAAPRDILRVIFRHRLKIAGIFFACVAAAEGYNLIATPKFEITASLLVKANRDVPVNGADQTKESPTNNQDFHDLINSHLKILEGRDIALQTLNEVGLEAVYPTVVDDPPKVGTPMDEAITRLGQDLFVDSPRETNLINLSLFNASQDVGVKVLTTLMARFLEKQGRVFSNPQSDFVQQQAEVSRQQLEQAQAELEKFRLENNISSIDEERIQLIHQRFDLDSQLRQTDGRVTEDTQRLNALTQALKSQVPSAIELYSDSDLRYRAVDDTYAKLQDLQVKEQDLLKNYLPDSEPVRRNRAQIDLLKQQLATLDQRHSTRKGVNPVYQDVQTDIVRLTGDLEAAKAGREKIATQVQTVARALTDIDRQQAIFQNLQRQYEIADQNYRTYMKNVEEARITADLNRQNITGISVVEPATASIKPKRPRIVLNLALGIALGLILGIMTAVMVELFDESMGTPGHVETALSVPVFATLPMLQPAANRRSRKKAAA